MIKKSSLDLESVFKKDKEYYKKIILDENPETSTFLKSHQPVVVFGAGNMGKLFSQNLKKNHIPVLHFIDNNPVLHNTLINGIKVISVKEAQKHCLSDPILIASLLYETEIYSLLSSLKFKRIYSLMYLNFINPKIFVSPEYHNTFNSLFIKSNQQQILNLLEKIGDEESKKVFQNLIMFRLTMSKKYLQNAISDKQFFFEKNVMPLSKQEILADCGAFDGDSVENFIKATSGSYEKIYSFEPDNENYKKLKKRISENKYKNVILIKKGVFNITGRVGFTGGGSFDARVTTKESIINKDSTIKVIKLDDYFKNKKPPTLIKMDIEGAETEALKGGRTIIKQNKPKLAISAYHLATDPWKIPLLILSMNKKYKLYFRHYSSELPDTICYAL